MRAAAPRGNEGALTRLRSGKDGDNRLLRLSRLGTFGELT